MGKFFSGFVEYCTFHLPSNEIEDDNKHGGLTRRNKMSNQEDAEIPTGEGENNNPEIELNGDNTRLARAVVSTLVDKGIKVLALDFDKTIVSIHTAGFWTQPTSQLVEHVRPCFRALIQAGLETRLHLCIVTYSMQPALIRDVIRMALPRR